MYQYLTHSLVESVILVLLFSHIKAKSTPIVTTEFTDTTDFLTTEEEYITEGPEHLMMMITKDFDHLMTLNHDKITEDDYVTEGPEHMMQSKYFTEGPDHLTILNDNKTTEEEYITEGTEHLTMLNAKDPDHQTTLNYDKTTEVDYVTEGPEYMTQNKYLTEGPDYLTTINDDETEGPEHLLTQNNYVTEETKSVLTATKNFNKSLSQITAKGSNSTSSSQESKNQTYFNILIAIGILIVICTILLVTTICLAYQVCILKCALKKQRKRDKDFWSSGPSQLPADVATVKLEQVKSVEAKEEAKASKDEEAAKPLL
ncbi:uncharacterized protein LOC122563944 [Chiloscyllium plagiosum]|uniref:uncharacterized protein LOC122563944 n=1 Tax=Chiloscyllium plagiosum TaxID=36176 RepID=UPI001CB7EFFD|nr:uncharacterized protein LOC122563944 [Chiloscyllium plagiosum]